jgi:hypothetical protein
VSRERTIGFALVAALTLCACTDEPVPLGPDYPTDPGCAEVPWPREWEYVGTALEPGEHGEFDFQMWGGFGGSPIRFGDEILLYYQGAEGFSERQQAPRARSIGLAVSTDGITFA